MFEILVHKRKVARSCLICDIVDRSKTKQIGISLLEMNSNQSNAIAVCKQPLHCLFQLLLHNFAFYMLASFLRHRRNWNMNSLSTNSNCFALHCILNVFIQFGQRNSIQKALELCCKYPYQSHFSFISTTQEKLKHELSLCKQNLVWSALHSQCLHSVLTGK